MKRKTNLIVAGIAAMTMSAPGVLLAGSQSKAQAETQSQLRTQFQNADQNDDGKLNFQEYRAAATDQTGGSSGHDSAESGQPQSLEQMKVGTIDGMEVYNQDGKQVGDIEHVVRDNQSGDVKAVLSVGGLWGIGDKDLIVGFDELKLDGDRLTMSTSKDEEKLENREEYQEESYTEIPDGDVTLAQAKSGKMEKGEMSAETEGKDMQRTAGTDFEQLDANNDGQIDQAEAQNAPELSQNWKSADRNDDGKLDRGEFSAFEANHSGGMKSHKSTSGHKAEPKPGSYDKSGSGQSKEEKPGSY